MNEKIFRLSKTHQLVRIIIDLNHVLHFGYFTLISSPSSVNCRSLVVTNSLHQFNWINQLVKIDGIGDPMPDYVTIITLMDTFHHSQHVLMYHRDYNDYASICKSNFVRK